MTKTEEVISSMLKENTGASLLDSGGAYGRNWERNQEREFEGEPRATFDKWGEVTISLFHFLNDRLTYMEEEDKAFHEWAKDKEDYWLSLMEEYPIEIGGRVIDTINSYNQDSLLSQVIQYTIFENADGETRILLQVHGGCDVRGGYTAPRVFAPEDSYMCLYGESASVQCSRDYQCFNLDWSGGEWLQEGCTTDFKIWEYANEFKGDRKLLPCPNCGANLEATAWNTI